MLQTLPSLRHEYGPSLISAKVSRISLSHMNQIQAFINTVYKSSPYHITRIDSIAASPRKGYIIETSEGHQFVLKTAPSGSVRLLRHESATPADEAHVLNRIHGLGWHVPVPRFLSTSYDSANPLNGPYLLRTHFAGTPLSSISQRFTTYDREQIDKSIGAYMRVATNASATQFGTLNRVARGSGYDSWRSAFHSLLESALRDAEDAALTLPYQSIRYWMGLNMHWLDVVTEPHLVPLRAGMPETVLVDEARKRVVGIVAWGDTVWGDPALGQVFDAASVSFWAGFGGQKMLQYGDGGDAKRGYIYTVYRTLVTIVKNALRPRLGVDESEARRLMNWALHQLTA